MPFFGFDLSHYNNLTYNRDFSFISPGKIYNLAFREEEVRLDGLGSLQCARIPPEARRFRRDAPTSRRRRENVSGPPCGEAPRERKQRDEKPLLG